MRLIIATKNNGKLREIKKIMKSLKLTISSLNDLKETVNIRENGKSFFENACKKATATSRRYPFDLIVGEDSGLEIKALNDEPGIFSRRYSGPRATDESNNRKVLRKLKRIPTRRRQARFRCVLVLMKEGKLLAQFEGIMEGRIHDAVLGRDGFGYDPIFYIPHLEKTVAQLSLREKNEMSHRAKAFKELEKFLANYIENN